MEPESSSLPSLPPAMKRPRGRPPGFSPTARDLKARAAQRGPRSSSPAKPSKDPRRGAESFLYPEMPKALTPGAVRKWSPEKRMGRYLEVYLATMGNHSMALFYCCWDQEEFDGLIAAFPQFARQITNSRAQLADRATFLMHRGMGLVKIGDEERPSTNLQVSSAMARVVEGLRARHEPQNGFKQKGFKLVVEGLERDKVGDAAVPPKTTADDAEIFG